MNQAEKADRFAGAPAWWHSSGRFFAEVSRPLHSLEVTFTDTCCHVKVRKLAAKDQYLVRTYIFAHNQLTRLSRRFTAIQLATAFDAPRDYDESDAEYAKGYDADAGVPGLFIRKGPFLNIVAPGIGMDGDPNVSVYVSSDIKRKVHMLIQYRPPAAA